MVRNHEVLDMRKEADAIRVRALLGIEPMPAEKEVLQEVQKAKKRSKYGAIPEWVDGKRFASGHEAKRYRILCIMLHAGEIRDLHTQVPYILKVNHHRITKYIADFVYVSVSTSEEIVEDAKGFPTPAYKIKRRLMLAIHGIKIHEVYRAATGKRKA